MLDRINAPNRIIPAAGSIRRAHGRSSGDSRPGFFNQLTGLQARYLDGGENGQFTRTVNGTARVIDQSRTGTPRQMQPGRCFSFDGVGDYVDVSGINGADLDGDYSCLVMFRADAANGSSTRLWSARTGSSAAVELFAGGAATLTVRHQSADVDYVYSPSSDWLEVSYRYSAGQLEAWTPTAKVIDEALTGQGSPTSAVRIGSRSDALSQLFTGEIAYLVLLSRAITDEEVAAWQASRQIPEGCLGFFKCDEGAGTIAYDSSGSGNHGAITATAIGNFHNATANDIYSFQNELGYTDSSGTLIPRDESSPTLDAAGNALQYSGQAPRDAILSSPCGAFDGSGDYVDTPLRISGVSSYELEAWVKTTTTANDYIIGGRDGSGDGVILRMSGGVFAFNHNASTVSPDTAHNDGAWHHVRAVWDGAKIYIYVDGLLQKEASATTPLAVQNTARVGARADTIGANFAGNICHVKIKLDGVDKLHYPICEGSGTAIYDVSGNGNHGTLIAASEANFWANQQNVVDTLTTHGYRRSGSVNIPALQDGSAGLAADGSPLTHGPGFLALGQSLDVSGGEANSPYVQQLAALLADTDYDSGDNSEADALFARVNAGGDDRILTTVPALTGDDLTRMNAYTE